MDWSDYGARILFLITDAVGLARHRSAGGDRHERSSDRAGGPAAPGQNFRRLHLRTPQGAKNHALAERQYRQLTADVNPRIGDLYVPILTGDVDRFGTEMERIASAFTLWFRRWRWVKP